LSRRDEQHISQPWHKNDDASHPIQIGHSNYPARYVEYLGPGEERWQTDPQAKMQRELKSKLVLQNGKAKG